MAVELVLGIDLGPNSIGWALIDDDLDNAENSQLVDIGVRVFPEGVDAFDTSKEASRNENRRVVRGMRRQTARRAQRHRKLREALVEAGLWPAEDLEAETALYNLNPYELRARGLNEKLSPHEIGRVLLHLNQRRGFKSNKKRDSGDREIKGMLAEINENEAERTAGGYATIGAWLADKCPKAGSQARQYHTKRCENDRVRRRHLTRQQYEEEFEAIWQSQVKHHPRLLTDELKYGSVGWQQYPCKPKRLPRKSTPLKTFGLQGLIFFQRPMYWPKSVVGRCALEPKQKRCPRADRRYQRFRLLQEVNNLKYIDPDTHQEQKLSDQQRQLLLDKLNRTKELSFDKIRKALGFLETVKFNLERGSRSKIKGVPVDAMLAAAKVLGKKWHDRPEQQKDEIVQCLLDSEQSDEDFIATAVSKWNMTPTEAEAALGVELPPGYGNLSLRALDELLPHMEKGLLYMAEDETNSALHAAGYLRRDQLQRRLFDKLPDPKRTRGYSIGEIPNPVVKRALTEVRHLINSIINEYGKPDAIHVEMARAVQLGKEKRSEAARRMRDRESQRAAAADKIREMGERPNCYNILKYLLWEQQGGLCIYSGEPISSQKLFGSAGGVEIDHILPRSRTLDDSQMNKAVCLREANAEKGDQTPHEWLADRDPQRYEQICQRAGKLMRAGKFPYAKYRRFIQKELDLNKFIARQLNDTGYITKATAEYLRCLFEKPHKVLGLKGQLTAELRWHWGLETVLVELPDSPAWQDEKSGKLRPGEKNRADHRHHAIDALVIALTNRSRLQQLSYVVKRGGARTNGEIFPEPWPNFRDAVVHAVKRINVSHRVERKVRGALHEETFYGPTSESDKWVVRKPLVNLSASEIENIRDEAIYKLVQNALCDAGIEFGRGKKIESKKMKEVLGRITMPSGVPIKKVRIFKQDKTMIPIREGTPGEVYVKPGSTHHICIFEWQINGETRRDAVFVTMLEAKQRLKNGKPLIQRFADKLAGEDRERIPPDAKFVMSLSSGEMVIADWKGEDKLLTYKTAASTQGQIYFAEHTDARRSSDYKRFVFKANTLKAKKVTADPLGRIRCAND